MSEIPSIATEHESLCTLPEKKSTDKSFPFAVMTIAGIASIPFFGKKKRTIIHLTHPDQTVVLSCDESALDPLSEKEGQKQDIEDLVSTIADKGVLGLGLDSDRLGELGKKIEESYDTHPLLFLLLSPKDKIRKILNNSSLAYKKFVFPKFLGDIQRNLQSAKENPRFNSLARSFARKLDKDPIETLRHLESLQDQKSCIAFLQFISE